MWGVPLGSVPSVLCEHCWLDRLLNRACFLHRPQTQFDMPDPGLAGSGPLLFAGVEKDDGEELVLVLLEIVIWWWWLWPRIPSRVAVAVAALVGS